MVGHRNVGFRAGPCERDVILEFVVAEALAGEDEVEAANPADGLFVFLPQMHKRHDFLHQRPARGLALAEGFCAHGHGEGVA